jgi:Fe-S cluster assembly ATP-binding protein
MEGWMADLEIKDLTVQVEDKVILKGANLAINKGEIHALMGPNGSGKSTLANVLMGNPFYQVVKGEVLYKGEDLLAMSPDERARKGSVHRLPISGEHPRGDDVQLSPDRSFRAPGI